MSRGSSASENYVPIRTGILDHLVRGDISLYELGVYVLIHLQADYSTGVWRGSAPRILANAPRGVIPQARPARELPVSNRQIHGAMWRVENAPSKRWQINFIAAIGLRTLR